MGIDGLRIGRREGGKGLLRLLLVRHGETDWNAGRRIQGQLNVPLNAQGHRQAKQLACYLKGEPIAAIYASDLLRAWETARYVAQATSVPVTREPRLREIHFGEWQGLTFEEAQRRDPEAAARWLADPVRCRPPGGETFAELAARVADCLEEICDRPDGTVLVVSHGGTIRAALCTSLEYPLRQNWRFEVYNTSVSELVWRDRGPVVVRWNDTAHLHPDGC